MRKLLFTLICTGMVCLSVAQEKATITIESVEGPKPYTSLNLNNDPGNFQFAIVTDRTGGHRPGVFLDGIKKLNLLQPEFVMSVGDLIEGYTTDVAALDRQWKEFNGFIDSLQVPFFYLPGNHDITNKVMEEKWKELFGKTYYHFKYKDVLFLCLNSEDNYRGSSKGTIGDEQYEWIKQTLEANQDVRWTLVFLHQPLWAQSAETLRWNDVEQLLAPRKHTVYAGHRHSFVKYDRNNGKYFILATTGGGSALRGPELGEFDHVSWITMTDEGPIMANLQLEGIWSEDMVSDKMKSFFYPMVNNNPVSISPVLTRDDRFSEGAMTIKVTNDSDVMMQADLTFDYNVNLLPGIDKKSIEVNPNSMEEFEVVLKASADKDLSQVNVLKLQSTVKYLPENMPEVKVDYNNQIKPEVVSPLRTVKRAVKVDGQLKEWKDFNSVTSTNAYLNSDPFSHKGDQDAAFKIATAYDKEFLYVAAEIIDDELFWAKGNIPTRQDAFHFTLDAKTLNAKASNKGTLYIGANPSKTKEKNERLYRSRRLPDGTQSVVTKTANGYQVELAIPMGFIVEHQGENWSSLRMNFWQTDYDKNGDRVSSLFWRPDWRGEGNYVGSGTFMRE